MLPRLRRPRPDPTVVARACLTRMNVNPLRFASLCAALLLVAGCDGNAPATMPDAGTDAGTAAPMRSTLFGPCETDEQCPGMGAVCRRASEDGYPGGYCTVPCSDRTPCDYRSVYHHCLRREGETQAYCERRCLNGIDCGRSGYSCGPEIAAEAGGACLPVCTSDEECGGGAICNLYSGQCGTRGADETLAPNGAACAFGDDCRSGGCVAEASPTGVPTGWVGGYCVSNCILPGGYNTSSFFEGSELPQGTCPEGGLCIPSGQGQARGDMGSCYVECRSATDCRPGYTCLSSFGLGSGGTANYTNGICVPADCSRVACPSGYTCRSITGADGRPRNVCAR